ncbi:uncharacterized protein JCM6883_002353 [Sporobolomyces salmoneus]|uniref:uncharacterized protein n=1 Tax=Sporobolomyces salmoneus TaxID=183962 RepID=UPI00317DE0D1
MVPFIPYDALECIFEHVEDDQDLAQSCLASKALLSVARPRLYETIRIEVVEYEMQETRGHETISTMRYGLQSKTETLLSILRHKLHLRSLVRTVDLTYDPFLDDEEMPPTSLLRPEPTELLDELLQLFTSAKHFHLDLPECYQAELDEAVERHQLSGQNSEIPSFRLASFSESSAAVLRGKYRGFHRSWIRDADEPSLPSLLVRSQHSLRDLFAPLEDLDFRSFTRLERLHLWLPYGSTTAAENVLQVLFPLSSLRTLVLTDAVEGLATVHLLATGKLADALPSLLATLLIEYDYKETVPDAPLSFRRALPATSKLKRVNFLRYTIEDGDFEEEGTRRTGQEGIEESKEGDLIGEYEKRGIRLSFDEEWLTW